MRSVHASFKKSASCETVSTVPLWRFERCSPSQIHALRSRWFVGSSSSSKSVPHCCVRKRARASATRMRHPPERLLHGPAAIRALKPRPARMRATTPSAAAPPLACSSAVTSSSSAAVADHAARSPPSSPSASPSAASSLPVSSLSRPSSRSLDSSATSTSSETLREDFCASCSTRTTRVPFGSGRRPAARSRSSVDLPEPLAPRRP
mmetsp:Transcript_12347/g.24593  ORF Transcript_12347/g.24593 Transcript_12347/m.24593 type:complete len:207 (+) Transcript_12347:1402-2022(+)